MTASPTQIQQYCLKQNYTTNLHQIYSILCHDKDTLMSHYLVPFLKILALYLIDVLVYLYWSLN